MTLIHAEETCTGNLHKSTCMHKKLARVSYLTMERILFKIAITTYRALNGSAPVYLSSYFTRVTDVPSPQRLRSASSNQLAVLPFNLSTVGKRAFPVSGANFWNSTSYLINSTSITLYICTVARDIQTAS